MESFVLPGRVPVLALADQKQVDIWLADLSGSNTHASTFPEARRATKTFFAEVDSIKNFLTDWELVYLRYASLQEDVVAFLDEDGRFSGEGRRVLQHAHFS